MHECMHACLLPVFRRFECVHKKLCRANCTNDFQHELAADYGSPQESAHTVLGRYYHYSVISVRRFLMNAMADGTLKRLGWSECELLSYVSQSLPP